MPKICVKFTVSLLHPWFHIHEFNNHRSCSSSIYWKKSKYKWTHAVQTHVVQGSTVYNTFRLSIHLPINTWLVSTFSLLWIMLLSTFMYQYKYLFESLFAVLLGTDLGVELPGHMVILTFWGTTKLHHFTFSPARYRVPVSPHSPQDLLILSNLVIFCCCCFLNYSYLRCGVVSHCGFDLYCSND